MICEAVDGRFGVKVWKQLFQAYAGHENSCGSLSNTMTKTRRIGIELDHHGSGSAARLLTGRASTDKVLLSRQKSALCDRDGAP
jgi:hypothetical protein